MSNGINWNALTNLAQNRMLQSLQPPANLAPQPQLPLLGVIFVDGRSGVDAQYGGNGQQAFYAECQRRGIDPNQALPQIRALFNQLYGGNAK